MSFYITNPGALFESFIIIPNDEMTFDEKMNAISRLILVIGLALFVLGFNKAISLTILAEIVIIIVWYKEKKMSVKKEMFSQKICHNDYQQIEFDSNHRSPNQTFSGPPNPKTKIPVLIVPPIVDQYWNDGMSTYKGINADSHEDLIQSGYIIDGVQCGTTQDIAMQPIRKERMPSCVSEKAHKEGFTMPSCAMKYEDDYTHKNYTHIMSPDTLTGEVLTTCAYDPDQLIRYNLPSNAPFGRCQRSEALKDYNMQLFTQPIQPGLYSRYEVIEPISSNIGISFQQQFEPMTIEENENNLIYTSNDPYIRAPVQKMEIPDNEPNMNNVYDPRFSGYGDSNRAYIDKMTGQVRYFYDDVDAIRRPNLITKNNLDIYPFTQNYGPMEKPENCYRELANQQFHDSQIQFRTDLMERLMRKRNAEMWQRRVAPISRASNTVNSFLGI